MKKTIILISTALLSISLFGENMSFSDSVRVIKSSPQYRTVTTRTPYQECWNEQVPVNSNNENGTIGALIGGVAGGILGHQVGGGSGKTAATVGGAIIGTLVGKNLSENQNSVTTYKNQRKCVTKYDERSSEKFIGYRNIANYKGRTIVKFSDRPLRRIRLNITVSY
ncbi:MAG: glycine zipper 2TM domain-containing protein [Epsilonproteobacteria bacterium]|nr:glycine zipper 2TM domain-containing protein [Campylobacterota bacterium]